MLKKGKAALIISNTVNFHLFHLVQHEVWSAMQSIIHHNYVPTLMNVSWICIEDTAYLQNSFA